VTILNGLDALDQDRSAKTAGRRQPRPIPPPKQRPPTPNTDSTTAAQAVAPAPLADAPEVVDLREPEIVAKAPHKRSAPHPPATVDNQSAGADKKALRAAQVYMDDITDDHLRRIKAAALIEGADVTGSAVVRRAVAELVERHGYDGIVQLIQNDPIVQRGKGRPRR
jgi:hypothetical protein